MADVGGDLLGDHDGDLVRQVHAQQSRLVFHNGKPGLEVRRRHVRQQAPLKAGPEPVVQQGHFGGGPVGGQDDLPPGLVKGIEGVKEFVLDLLLPRHKLHVVHEKQVRLPVLGPEFAAPVGPDQLHELVDKLVSLDVDDFGGGVVLPDDVRDGVEQMGFSQTRVPVDEKGVVVLGRVLRHGHGGGVGQLVGWAHNKIPEGKLRVGKAVRLALGRGPPLEFQEPGVVENLHLKVGGKDIPKGGLDVVQKQGFQVPPFEIAGAVQVAGIAPDVHDAQLVEPGGDGGLGERTPQLVKNVFPNIGDGIQRVHLSFFWA